MRILLHRLRTVSLALAVTVAIGLGSGALAGSAGAAPAKPMTGKGCDTASLNDGDGPLIAADFNDGIGCYVCPTADGTGYESAATAADNCYVITGPWSTTYPGGNAPTPHLGFCTTDYVYTLGEAVPDITYEKFDQLIGTYGSAQYPGPNYGNEAESYCLTSSGLYDPDLYQYDTISGEAEAAPTIWLDSTDILCDGSGSVTIHGAHWTASEKATITIYSTPTLLGTVSPDTDGTFTTVVKLPKLEAGTHTLVVEDSKGKKASLTCTCFGTSVAGISQPVARTGSSVGGALMTGAAFVVGGFAMVLRARRLRRSAAAA